MNLYAAVTAWPWRRMARPPTHHRRTVRVGMTLLLAAVGINGSTKRGVVWYNGLMKKKSSRMDPERKKIQAGILAKGCQTCPTIRGHMQGKLPWFCNGTAVDMHEIKTRARGGSTTDPNNILATCRRGHIWVTNHPKESVELGLMANSWD